MQNVIWNITISYRSFYHLIRFNILHVSFLNKGLNRCLVRNIAVNVFLPIFRTNFILASSSIKQTIKNQPCICLTLLWSSEALKPSFKDWCIELLICATITVCDHWKNDNLTISNALRDKYKQLKSISVYFKHSI